jgi:hypothetical protein
VGIVAIVMADVLEYGRRAHRDAWPFCHPTPDLVTGASNHTLAVVCRSCDPFCHSPDREDAAL